MISRFRIRSLEDVSHEPELFTSEYVLTIRVENAAVPDEEIVEHFLMTSAELAQLFGEAGNARDGEDVFEKARRLETQVADLRRELERERAHRTVIAGVAMPAGTPVTIDYSQSRINSMKTMVDLRAKLDRSEEERDDLKKVVRRLEEELERERTRCRRTWDACQDTDRKLRAILGIKFGDDIMEAVRSLVRSDDDSLDEEEEDGVEEGDGTLIDWPKIHAILDSTGANFPPMSPLKSKIRAVCDEFLRLRSTWSGMDPVAVSKAMEDCGDLRRFRDAVGQMTGADNPRSIPSVMAALSRLVTAPQLEAKARIDGEPKKVPASYVWRFYGHDRGERESGNETISAPTIKEARDILRTRGGSWSHNPASKEERDRAYMESCDYPPRMVNP